MSVATPSSAREDREEIEYPASDGEPMAETEVHLIAIFLLLQALRDTLLESAYVIAEMFWYWEEGKPSSRVAPDVMVVKDVGRAIRRSFFTWREGGAIPSVVFEMASEHTWRENLVEKRRLYERLGVREYFLFDPEGEYLRPRLLGFRLIDGRYELIAPGTDDSLPSQELNLGLRAEGTMLRLIDGTTGTLVPTREERAERERLNAERERLNAERERLNAERERLRAERERLNAEREHLNAEQQRAHAEQERERADALAAEVDRLKALLEKTGGPPE